LKKIYFEVHQLVITTKCRDFLKAISYNQFDKKETGNEDSIR